MYKELLNQINDANKLINSFFSNKKFNVAEASDNSSKEVKYDSLEVGSGVYVAGGEGSEVAPDGKYDLSNGVSFEVKEGKISEVYSTGDVSEVEEMNDDDITEQEPTEDSAVTELKTKIADLENKLAELESKLAEKEKSIDENFSKVVSIQEFTNLKTVLNQLTDAITLLSKTPSNFSKVDERKEAEVIKENNLKALANAVQKSKKMN